MHVFVWGSYGTIGVYEADTIDKLKKIYEKLRSTILEFYDGDVDGPLEPEEDPLLKVYGGNGSEREESYITQADNLPLGYRNRSKSQFIHWENKIEYLIDGFGLDTHETFEYGTGFEELTNPLDEP